MRPKIWHHVMTGLSALALLGTTVFAIVRWGSLDGKIPTHFDSAGQPTSSCSAPCRDAISARGSCR